jgi:hypothetical protein
MTIEQFPLFPDIEVQPGAKRRGNAAVFVAAKPSASSFVRLAVFTLCRSNRSVTTAMVPHPMARVRAAFYALERASMIRIGTQKCRNPLGYRLTARLHPSLKHLRVRKGRKGAA